MAGDYGWLRPMPPGQQRHGFFIDDDNRILFWPGRDAPGYVLDEATAGEVLRARGLLGGGGLDVLIGIVVLGVGQGLAAWAYPWLHALFSPSILGFAAAAVLLLAAWPAAAWWRGGEIRRLLAGMPQLARLRPEVRHLKPSRLMAHPSMFWLSVVVSAAVGVGFVAAALFEDALPGDRLALAALGTGLVALMGLLLSWEVKGVHPDAVRFYRPAAMPLAAPPRPAPSPRRRVATVIGTVAAVIGLAWVFVAFTTTRLTADLLEDVYGAAAARPNGDGVVKWAGPVALYLGGPADAEVHPHVAERLRQAVALAGVGMDLTAAVPERGIAVTFLADARLRDGRHDAAGGGYWADTQGRLVRARAEISPVSLFALAGERAFGDKAVRDRVVRRLGDAVTLWVMGLAMAGPVDVDARYEDAAGRPVRIADVLVAMHYDPRIVPGMPVAEARGAARAIAEEIAAAPSWADWLATRRR